MGAEKSIGTPPVQDSGCRHRRTARHRTPGVRRYPQHPAIDDLVQRAHTLNVVRISGPWVMCECPTWCGRDLVVRGIDRWCVVFCPNYCTHEDLAWNLGYDAVPDAWISLSLAIGLLDSLIAHITTGVTP